MTQPQKLSPRQQSLLALIRCTPLKRGKLRRFILEYIKKRIAHPIITDFRGVPFIFNLDNTTEQKALFGHYNLEELAFLKKSTDKPSSVFVDIGANSGFYTQNFLAGAGERLALAIEPNPAMCARIKANYELLSNAPDAKSKKLLISCCAVGDVSQNVELDLSIGVGAAHVSDKKSPQSILVKMEKLADVIAANGIQHIDVLKADIEGYEDRALMPFFIAANPRLLPSNIIIEHTSEANWQGDILSVMKDKGYTVVGKTRGNLLLSR